MERVRIAGTELTASRIGLGAWAIGGSWWGGTDEGESVRAILRALELGIDLVDTAPVYGQGLSEQIVGRALREHGDRDSVVLATKTGLSWPGGETVRDARAATIRRELEESLRRLGTDHVDLYQVHWPDPLVPVEETARAMAELYESGKVRAVGVSNFTPEQMETFRGVAPLHTSQPPYNLFEREVEADVLPYCHEHGITTLTYGVLCRGLLSGRMHRETEFPGGDLRGDADPKFQPPRFATYLEAVDRLDRFALENYGKRVLHLAARWALDRPGVGIALWGARRPEQIDAVEDVFGWSLDEDAMETIDRIVASIVKDPVGPEFMAPPVRKK